MAASSGSRSIVPFVLVGLAIALVIGVFVSNFAASTPDALQRAIIDSACEDAEDKEVCLAEQEGEPVFGIQPGFLFDYGVTWLSGLVGIVICFALGAGIVFLLRQPGGLIGRRFSTGQIEFLGGGHHLGDVEAVAAGDSPVHRLDPRVKIVGLIGLVVVSVSLPPGAWLAFGALAAILIALVVVARLHPLHVLRRMTVEIPFLVAAAILPFTAEDGLVLGVTVGIKITLGVLGMVILSSTTPFPKLLRGFELLRTPHLIVMIVSFMWRYLHVLGNEVSNMRTARAARGYSARFFWQAAASTGSLVAALFVRSLGRGERVYLAMLSRGYTGTMPVTAVERLALRAADVSFLAALAVALVFVRVLLP